MHLKCSHEDCLRTFMDAASLQRHAEVVHTQEAAGLEASQTTVELSDIEAKRNERESDQAS
jgi:hypothetical protein